MDSSLVEGELHRELYEGVWAAVVLLGEFFAKFVESKNVQIQSVYHPENKHCNCANTLIDVLHKREKTSLASKNEHGFPSFKVIKRQRQHGRCRCKKQDSRVHGGHGVRDLLLHLVADVPPQLPWSRQVADRLHSWQLSLLELIPETMRGSCCRTDKISFLLCTNKKCAGDTHMYLSRCSMSCTTAMPSAGECS